MALKRFGSIFEFILMSVLISLAELRGLHALH
jgi:hypothetical protein